ncbi:unnamed protein product [Polarella glacialis]|uniref:Reverse transcriptase domain-containing protein n=1 Tax=Polarella glacialis TaxID=89957 RepID=A0A813FW34_POLGL|nr:unnamed protein product [Polarella glacialis]
MHEVLARIGSDIICLESTGAKWGGFMLRKDGQGCFVKNIGKYWVINWPCVPSNPWANHTWGVAIAIKRQVLPKSSLAAIYTPDESIQGRAGCIRLQLRSGPDFFISVAYLPPGGAMAHGQQASMIWNWLETTFAKQPLRTLPIFGMDANAGIGNQEMRTPDRLLQVGNFGRSNMNRAGREMRGFMQRTSLSAINTLFRHSAGNTWYNTRGHTSRIDFILSIPYAAQETVEICVDRRLGFLLQNAAAQLADHCPVTWKFTHPCPLPGHRDSQRWSRELVSYICGQPKLINGIYQTLDDWANHSTTTEAIDQAFQEGDVDTLWSLANEGASAVIGNYAPLQFAFQFPAESFEISQLLAQRWAQKQTLFSLASATPQIGAAIRKQERILKRQRIRIIEARKRWWNERQDNLAFEITQAADKHCWRQIWSGVRKISQSLLGPRGRVYHRVPSYFPTIEEWLQTMQLPGPTGGCHSKTIWQGDTDELNSFLKMGQMALSPTDKTVLQTTALDYTAPTEADAIARGQQDYVDLKAQLARRTNGFAIPQWSIPKDFWRLLLNGPWCSSELQQQQQPTHYQQLLQQLCILIRKTGWLPLQWLLSYGCGVPKYNDKPGALGYRLLHLLDPVSKAWDAALWRRRPFRLGQTAYGFIQGRRREEANMLVRIMAHRLSQAGYLVIAALFDVANAFPSLAWPYLEQHSYKAIPNSDLHFLLSRHRQSLTFLTDAQQHAGVFRAMTGTRQGDTSAAQEFAKTFYSAIRDWCKSRYTVLDRLRFVARDPWTRTPVCLNSVLFADDLLKLIAVPRGSSPAQQLDSTIESLQQALHSLKLDLNMGKLQLMAFKQGPRENRRWNAFQDAVKAKTYCKANTTQTKHLGCTLTSFSSDKDYGSKVEVTQRIKAANHIWNTFWKYWTRSDVPLRYRVLVYRATCFNTLTSGLISVVLTKHKKNDLNTGI